MQLGVKRVAPQPQQQQWVAVLCGCGGRRRVCGEMCKAAGGVGQWVWVGGGG